jgi:hypothetical protein
MRAQTSSARTTLTCCRVARPLKRLRPRSPSCRRSCERRECLWAIVSVCVCRPHRVRTDLEERGRQVAHVDDLKRFEREQAA